MGETVSFSKAQYIRRQAEPTLELVDVYIASVPPKLGGSLMKELNRNAPLTGLPHLKRIRRVQNGDDVHLDVVLCPVERDNAGDDLPLVESQGSRPLPDAVQEIVDRLGFTPTVVQVAGAMPPTRELWKEWCRYWPISWKPTDPQSSVELHKVTDEMQEQMQGYMRTAMQLAIEHGKENAAVIVDPRIGRVIASGVDQSCVNPIRHACMEAIESAAKRDRSLWGGPTHTEQLNLPGKRRRLESSQDVALCTTSNTPPVSTNSELHSAGQLERPYLCTGFEVYTIKEPCVMCSMALVHSRVHTVVYCKADEVGGALGGARNLHGEKSLNHRYHVYHLPLRDQTENHTVMNETN